jgi:plastocyanin
MMKRTPSITTLLIVVILIGTSAAPGGNIKGKVTAKKAKYKSNAVIYVDKIPGKTFKAPAKNAQIDQKNLAFIPHVLPILAGTTVDFLNGDDVLHNVFTPDACAEKFNLGSWPKGRVRSFTFKQPGCTSVLLCNVHPEMEAYIVALETPYFAVSAKDGSYEIKNVPAGKYTLKIWHKRLKGSSVTVKVPAKGVATADFQLKR